MYQMVILVLDDIDFCSDVLEKWEATGVSGVTILESTGLGRMRSPYYRNDISFMPSLSSLLKSQEEQHRTIFTVVDSDVMVDALIQATQEVVGDLSAPNKGVIFVLPVSRVIGLHDWREDQ